MRVGFLLKLGCELGTGSQPPLSQRRRSQCHVHSLRGISEFVPPGRWCLLPEAAAGVFQAMEANYLAHGAIWE